MCNDSDNHLAPVIYVAESPEQAMNYEFHSRSSALSRNVCVMDLESIKTLGQGKTDFYLPEDINPGDILIRHPYHQGYILATKAEEEYLSESAEGFFLVARLLGATKIEYKKCEIAEYKREIDSSNGLEYKKVKVSLDVKESKEQELLKKIQKIQEFPKQEFTLEKFEKAKSIAEERGLLKSRDIRNLFDTRNPELGPLMTHQTVNVEISSSLNEGLDIAFTINCVPFFKLSSNTKIATEKKLVLNIEWDINFS